MTGMIYDWRDVVAQAMLHALGAGALVAALSMLYVLKSLAGINLFEGHFILHDVFFS